MLDVMKEAALTAIEMTPRPWETPGELPPKPDFAPCGFVRDETAEACAPEDLSRIFAEEPFQFLWLPEHPRFLRPEDVPALREHFRYFALKSARGATTWGMILTLGSVGLFLYFRDPNYLFRSLFFVLGGAMLAMGLWQYRQARNFTQDDARQMASEARFSIWLESNPLPQWSYTNALTAVLALVLVAQYALGGPPTLGLDAAALDKPLVRQGEWWRLLTATVMHGGVLHFVFNTMALRDFGRLIETLARGVFVPLVFLVSAVCGSLFSLVLSPQTSSVGASGGLLGMLGFLLVASLRRPDAFPRWFVRNSVQNVVWIALLGVAGFAFIDNAAHLGGLLGGALMGWLLTDRNGRDFPLQPTNAVRVAGWIASTLIIATAAWAVWLIRSGG